MNFELTEEQEEIKQAVREFAEKEFTPELAREYDRKEEFPMELYRKAAQLGFIGLHFDEDTGVEHKRFYGGDLHGGAPAGGTSTGICLSSPSR